MPTSVKSRIRFGTLFFFLLTLLSSAVGIYHLVRLSNQATRILNNNYESLNYGQHMLQLLNQADSSGAITPRFDSLLQLQEANLTEAGERETTERLRTLYQQSVSQPLTSETIRRMRMEIDQLLLLNMHAIESKNQRVSKIADEALTVLSGIAALLFIIGLSFTVNFPAVLVTPIKNMTEGVQEISRGNYQYRLHLDRKDEFQQMAGSFNQMAERLEYFENSNLNRLIFEKARAEAVINSLKEATIGIDSSGNILFANEEALLLLGIPDRAVAGKSAEELSRQNDLFRFLLEENGGMPFRVVLDGKENYFTREQLDVKVNDAHYTLIVIRNITSFKEQDSAKNNFIATISHELKTPLAASDFSIKLLEDVRTGSLTPEQQELVQGLRKDNQRMLKILSELLNMAQVEAGRIELTIQPVDPKLIADAAMAANEASARSKSIVLRLQSEPAMPMMKADLEKTGWVLNNLLSNAIRYSPGDSTVLLNVKLEERFVLFSVVDQGPGIKSEYQSRIFNRFFRIPGTVGSGTGLGLSISKDFIEAQDGEIGVRSEAGQGSEFYFRLPIA